MFGNFGFAMAFDQMDESQRNSNRINWRVCNDTGAVKHQLIGLKILERSDNVAGDFCI